MGTGNIRLATSTPSLKDKIQTNINLDSDEIYWYIRFNIPLDETSVSEKTMDVTDTLGYIMRTDISYDKDKNMIVISPIDSYEQNIFYLLNITKKVRSAKGQYLKTKIHILFKLIGAQISEFKVLKSNVTVPTPKKRPKDYEKKIVQAKLLAIETEIMGDTPKDKLPYGDIKINYLVLIAAIIAVVSTFFVTTVVIKIATMAVCVVLLGLVLAGLSKEAQRSIIAYNIGVMNFNKERYEKAEVNFKRAYEIDKENQRAEYALSKVKYYL